MNKFIIEKAIIEKTNKDINICDNYEFVSGLNLICGANEAGKSSLMNFLRTTLSSKPNVDTGKIFVKYSQDGYLIQVNQKPSERVLYSLADNKKLDIKFLKENISDKAFQHVFSINLDDLMCIKETNPKEFITLLKDSSCDCLNKYIETTKKNVEKVLGARTVVNETAKIKSEILSLDKEINNYMNSENHYNSVVRELNKINNELKELSIIKDILTLDEKIKELEVDYKSLVVNFNSDLMKNSAEYFNLNEKVLDFNHNLEKIKENNQKIESLNSKILFAINKLKKEFYVEVSEDKLMDFKLDYSKIKQVASSVDKLKSIFDELKMQTNNKKSINNLLVSIDNKIEVLNSKYKYSNSIEEIEELHKFIDESIRYFNHLQNQVNEFESQNIVASNGINSNKITFFISILISIFSIAFAIFSFVKSMFVFGAIAIIIFAFSLVIIFSTKSAMDRPKEFLEVEKNKIEKDKILENLKEKLKDITPEILNMNQSLMMLKMNDLKQEIYTKKEQLSEKIQERTEQNQKLLEVENQIQHLERSKDEIVCNNKTLIKTDFESVELSETEYLQVIDIINTVKEVILEKVNIEETNQELIFKNIEIQNQFKNFVIENKIEILFEEDFSKKIEQLKNYYLENTKLNEKLEVIKVKLDSYKEEKAGLEKNKEFNSFIDDSVDIEFEIVQKNKKKEELLGQKNSLEHISGLEKLKIKRSVLQAKYDEKIADLLKKKIVLALCEKAKFNFDKKQPNLQKAQEFLSIMTDGKYTKISLENEVIQNDDGSIIKEWQNLSRGTKELLYFSLRLGFAINYSKDKSTLEPNGKWDLPLIIDDAFVNFDAVRTKNAIKCLVEFSRTNQVLFFTCHTESMKKYFEEFCEDFNVVNL